MTYSKPWSILEIVFFLVSLILWVILLTVATRHHKIQLHQAVSLIVLVAYLEIVFASTVFTRVPTVRQYKLIPLWSWWNVIVNHDAYLLKEILLNITLFIPVGILIAVIMSSVIFQPWRKMSVISVAGLMISVMIEMLQLILKRGLFEWDDMIHNGLGCMIGWVMIELIYNIWKKLRIKSAANSVDTIIK